MGDAWILDAVRTPRGRGKKEVGALSGIHPQDLLSTCLNALVERTGIDPCDVEDVVAGCVTAVGEQFDACPCNQLSWPGLSGRSSEGCLRGSLRF